MGINTVNGSGAADGRCARGSSQARDWINRTHKRTFFVSAYTDSCAAQNLELRNAIQAEDLEFDSGLPPRIGRGTIAFESAPDAVHKDFVTDAWVTDPLALILKRIRLGRQ